MWYKINYMWVFFKKMNFHYGNGNQVYILHVHSDVHVVYLPGNFFYQLQLLYRYYIDDPRRQSGCLNVAHAQPVLVVATWFSRDILGVISHSCVVTNHTLMQHFQGNL